MVTFRWRRGTTSICYSDRTAAEHDTVQRSIGVPDLVQGSHPTPTAQRLKIARRSYIITSHVSTATLAVVYYNRAYHQKNLMKFYELARSRASSAGSMQPGVHPFSKRTHTSGTSSTYSQIKSSSYEASLWGFYSSVCTASQQPRRGTRSWLSGSSCC